MPPTPAPPLPSPRPRQIFKTPLKALLALVAAGWISSPAMADSSGKPVEIAALLSITGELQPFGSGSLEGVQFAVEEANAGGIGPRIDLKIYDDKSGPEAGKEAAKQIVASPAAIVVGPSNTATSLAAGQDFAAAGIPSITTTATSDLITDNATTFRMLLKNSEQGELLATYLQRALGHHRAAVMVMDDGYGRTLEKGFRNAAGRLGIDATYHVFSSGDNFEEKAAAVAAEVGDRPVVLAMLAADGTRVLTALRRKGCKGPFLGGDSFGVENLNSRFADTPEDKKQPGFFSDNLFGICPMLLDSANADVLDFAERFKARFGHNPGWVTVAGYDAARLAIEAARKMDSGAADPKSRRAAALKYLLALNDPQHAPSGLLGPLIFDADRGRTTALRIGRFMRGRFESAPLQIVPVRAPHEAEIKSGAVFETHPGSYARLQQVIYSGLYLNEILWIDQAHFTFAADFYVWLRFAKNSGAEAADPTEIQFPDLSSGHFDREHPVETRDMPDGTSYRLWRVQGEFRNPFNLRRYPFDRQTLKMRFFNASAAADRIVYALDQSRPDDLIENSGGNSPSGASDEAFNALSQWKFVGAKQQRENFVAKSSLGDPRRVGRENFRELSGYAASVDLQRLSVTTVVKTMLPLLLMTCILFASLFFPPVLTQPKIAVAITTVLTGVVLLNTVNSQLGSVGYTVHVEFAFYVYFGLGLLHIVSVLTGEQLRAAGRPVAAKRVDFWTRVAFALAVFSLCAVALLQLKSA